MAATAHSDPYAIFLRKIGYSVGLERTLERFSDLLRLYLESGDVTLASWRHLVGSEAGWNLKSENIADVFYSLGFIHQTSGDVLVKDNLDAAAIATKLLTSTEQKKKAISFIFLWSIIVNDGEIFANVLLANFNDTKIKENLSKLVRFKQNVLRQQIPNRDAGQRIARVVTIERQEGNKGSLGAGKSIESLKRTEPLGGNRRLEVENQTDVELDVSEDYFRKVPPRRKDWARSLGLWTDEDGLTKLGMSFKASLISSGYVTEDGIFVFWPMEHELVRSGFKPNLLGECKSLWETLLDFARAYANLDIKPFETRDADLLVDQLDQMMRVYRSLHTRKSMLRREVSVTVAYPALVAFACGKEEPAIDVPQALDVERKGERRRVILRRSRNTGGALSVHR
jgi:hypothetical protein